jgi:hypothetical protein
MRRVLVACALVLALVTGAAVALAATGAATKSGTHGTKHSPAPHPVHAAQPRALFSFDRDIGMVEGDRRDSLWLMIADTTLVAGDSLTLISDEPDPGPDSPPEIFSAAVAQRLDRIPMQKMIPGPGDVFYRLVAPKGALNCCIFGYGVRVPRKEIRVVQARAEADLDHDGVPEHFQGCAGAEKIHAYVWSGEPFHGKRRWARDYDDQGSEGESDCPDEAQP